MITSRPWLGISSPNWFIYSDTPHAARVWTITATAEMAGLNPITYLTAYLDACGRAPRRARDEPPLTGPDLERFLPWTATPDDLDAWKQPPRPG